MLEAAAARYQPKRYDGRVLLILASERPPHLDFCLLGGRLFPGAFIPNILTGHHEDLVKEESAQRIAEAIHAHLVSVTGRGA